MFLDHGYRFFAPEPGPGHLVRYEVTTSDGAGAAGQFPDRDRIWPRLLYHRWFMLSETAFAASSSLPSPAEEQRWMADVRSQIGQLEQEGRYRR
ncbi:MAG: hypothetical protein GTO41_15415, partial [Burkholderiales bacterium]|nr:hypothetical protein [Burkholderiales bacterium]